MERDTERFSHVPGLPGHGRSEVKRSLVAFPALLCAPYTCAMLLERMIVVTREGPSELCACPEERRLFGARRSSPGGEESGSHRHQRRKNV
jgi:hypothetical protein